MREIQLNYSPLKALVDDEDYDWLSEYGWTLANGYAIASLAMGSRKNKVILRMHRIILDTPDDFQTDHKDHNKLNNQKLNLRVATQRQNKMNGLKRAGTTSIYKGVSWHKATNKWGAYIVDKNKAGKLIWLGLFVSEIEAAMTYNTAAVEQYGEFAFINPV